MISIAYSPDGTQFVSGAFNKIIMIWNVTTGQCVAGHSKGTLIVLSLLPFHLIAVTLSLALRIRPSGFGMPVVSV